MFQTTENATGTVSETFFPREEIILKAVATGSYRGSAVKFN